MSENLLKSKETSFYERIFKWNYEGYPSQPSYIPFIRIISLKYAISSSFNSTVYITNEDT